MEFDADGNLLRSWGGPGQGYDWPKNEHGILVDRTGNVWVGGNSEDDQILKVHARRQVPAADRQGRRHQGLELARRSSAARRTW